MCMQMKANCNVCSTTELCFQKHVDFSLLGSKSNIYSAYESYSYYQLWVKHYMDS